jgi:hypothetical protein
MHSLPQRLKLRSWLLGSLLVACGAANAGDAAGWHKQTRDAYDRCAFVGVAASIMGTVSRKDIDAAEACVESSITQAKAGYQGLAPDPRVTGALTDYFASWIGAMRALPDLLTLPRASAEAASTASRQRLSELWARVEIAGFK